MEKNVYYTCKNCKNEILESSRLLHEHYCRSDENRNFNDFLPPTNNNVNNNSNLLQNYKYCTLCDNYYHSKEYDDHMLSHQLDEQNIKETEINESEYDIVDKEEVLKKIEEDRIESVKFKAIKNKKDIGVGRKIFNYLFNCDNRVPPIIRIGNNTYKCSACIV
jgi:hypothetical protein